MKLIIVLTLALIGPSISFAGSCSLALTQQRVLQAALAIESIDGDGKPLTSEIHSYSSRVNTWAVILSYSGVQNIWTVETDSDGCEIKSVYRLTLAFNMIANH